MTRKKTSRETFRRLKAKLPIGPPEIVQRFNRLPKSLVPWPKDPKLRKDITADLAQFITTHQTDPIKLAWKLFRHYDIQIRATSVPRHKGGVKIKYV